MRPTNISVNFKDSSSDNNKNQDKPKGKPGKRNNKKSLSTELFQKPKIIREKSSAEESTTKSIEINLNSKIRINYLYREEIEHEMQSNKGKKLTEILNEKYNCFANNLSINTISNKNEYLEAEIEYNKDILTHPTYPEILYSQLLEYYVNGEQNYKLKRFLLVQINNYYYKFSNNRNITGLKNSDGNQIEIDCYNDELELGLEVQGKHHYILVDYAGKIKKNEFSIIKNKKIDQFFNINSNQEEFQDMKEFIELEEKSEHDLNNQPIQILQKLATNYKLLVKSFEKHKTSDKIKFCNFIEKGKLLIQAPTFIQQEEYYEFIIEGFKEERKYKIKSYIDGKDRMVSIKPFYFRPIKDDKNKIREFKEVNQEDFKNMGENDKLNVIEGYEINVKSPIKSENDKIIGIWSIKRNYNKILFQNTKISERLKELDEQHLILMENINFNRIKKFSEKITYFRDKRRISALEYVVDKGWTHVNDENLPKKLVNDNSNYIKSFLVDMVNEGLLRHVRKGYSHIYFPIDTQNLIIDENESPTKLREVIIQNGKISEDWLPWKEKREYIINYIKEKGCVESKDKILQENTGFTDDITLSKILSSMVNDGILKQ